MSPEDQPKPTSEQLSNPQQEEDVIIPDQYKDLPSEVVEEMWQNPIYADESKNETEKERREKTIQKIKEAEQTREQNKEMQMANRYAALPENMKQMFREAQKDVPSILSQCIRGDKQIDGLSREEEFVLAKLKSAYEEHKKTNPDRPFHFELGKAVDKKTYDNLAQRLAFKVLESKQNLMDQNQANEIRASLESPIQEINREGLLLADENLEGVASEPEQVDNPESAEKERQTREEVKKFLGIALVDESFKGLIDRYRNHRIASETPEETAERQAMNDLQIVSRMGSSMYDLIHQSGMKYNEVTDGISRPDKESFVANFNTEIADRLVNRVQSVSRVRRITEEELIRGGQPDQAAGFVWFKGNAQRPPDAREVRLYVNASPEGTEKVAEHLAKLSDQLDQNKIRLQFKFRKDLGEYDRTDTCVAYVYLPKGTTPEQKALSDQWVDRIKQAMSTVPKDSVRKQNSFFTEKITDGVSSAEDTREAADKKGESYTSQITKSIAESCSELSTEYDSFSPEAVERIASRTTEKLRTKNYF